MFWSYKLLRTQHKNKDQLPFHQKRKAKVSHSLGFVLMIFVILTYHAI